MPGAPIDAIERGLAAVGELLAADRVEVGVVVVGGTALNLLGIVRRTTSDVDVLALRPAEQELEAAGAWVREQDPTPEFAAILAEVMIYVRARRE